MEQLILPFTFLPLLVSLRSKQMQEKPHKTGCLSLYHCRCPNPKKHKLHNQIFTKKKMVHMMPVILVKPEYNFHNYRKSIFWVHTRRRKSLRLHLHQGLPSTALTLEDGRTRHVRMWNFFVCSDFCCCFNSTPIDRDNATENN